jgi:folate-dependent phosphoribosylglycinamide formyltransferase PurN
MVASHLKHFINSCREGAYLRPSNLRFALGQVLSDSPLIGSVRYSYDDHFLAAVSWLERAQDVVKDGGVCGRYKLASGWTSSYPETTGYIIPTFLQLRRVLSADRFSDRAQRAVDFLLGLQLPDGGFPGGEVDQNRTEPSPFNTAQIMHGLQAWALEDGDTRCVKALQKSGAWLCAHQDADGAWRKYFYGGTETTYSAHLTCWLAEAGEFLGEERFLEAAQKHLTWVLQHFDPEHNWFDLCGFSTEDHQARCSFTHTIAYTIWGVLRTAEVLSHEAGQKAAVAAAYSALRRLELSRWLPGVLDHRWRGVSNYACLTGNCQLALIWLHLYRKSGDPRLLNAAVKAIDLVRHAQPMADLNDGIRGGIAGSSPVWGGYISHAFPNWAAKYFIDACMASNDAFKNPVEFTDRPGIPADMPTYLPRSSSAVPEKKLTVGLLTTANSSKFFQFMRATATWNFRPDLVLIDVPTPIPLMRRVLNRLMRMHPSASQSKPAAPGAGTTNRVDVAQYCRQLGILTVSALPNSQEAVQAIRKHKIDILVHLGGGGILKAPIIEAPTLGTLNAHMGLLPPYRGMNVTEWALWNEDPVGCTVHLIDGGIDTGRIILLHVVDVSGAGNVAEARELVNQAQLAQLSEVLRYTIAAGELPSRKPQSPAAGLQYFTMHPELVERLNQRLRTRALVDCQVAGSRDNAAQNS